MVGGKKISFAALGPCRNEYEAWARGVGFRSSWLLSAKPAACFLLLLGLVATKLKPSRAPGPLAVVTRMIGILASFCCVVSSSPQPRHPIWIGEGFERNDVLFVVKGGGDAYHCRMGTDMSPLF